VHQVADFLMSLKKRKPCNPTFRDALETSAVCDAVLESAKKRAWRKVVVTKLPKKKGAKKK